MVKPSDGGRKSKLQNFLDVYFAALVYPIGIVRNLKVHFKEDRSGQVIIKNRSKGKNC